MEEKQVVRITKHNFELEVLQPEGLVLVDFWAGWCKPCLMLAPVIAEIAHDYEGKLRVCKLDVDEHELLAQNYNIRSIPTLIFFNGGKELKRSVGVISKNELQKMIDELLAKS
jgi:thioredoxin 1